MKHTLFIVIVLLTLISCASRKNLSNDIVYDENAERYQLALQRSKETFFATDSADIIRNYLGWAERLLTDAKISDTNMPSVFKRIDNDRFTIELPCWEFDTDEFWVSTIVVEHKRLDSALVKAKVQGVDDIFTRSNQRIVAHNDDKHFYVVDSVAYVEEYANYMRNAQFVCLCIMQEKKKYIVNATIRIRNPKVKPFGEAIREYVDEFLKQTENAEKP